MSRFLRENWLLSGVFGLSVLLALWLGGRALLGAIYWSDPQHRDAELRPWMTPRYVVMSYDLPRDLVLETLGVTADGSGARRIGRIAAERGVTLEELTEAMRAAAAAHRARGE